MIQFQFQFFFTSKHNKLTFEIELVVRRSCSWTTFNRVYHRHQRGRWIRTRLLLKVVNALLGKPDYSWLLFSDDQIRKVIHSKKQKGIYSYMEFIYLLILIKLLFRVGLWSVSENFNNLFCLSLGYGINFMIKVKHLQLPNKCSASTTF